MVDAVKKFLHRLFEEYKLVRRLGILGLYVLIVFASWNIFTNLMTVTTAAAAAYSSLCGLLAVMFKFYNDSRDRD